MSSPYNTEGSSGPGPSFQPSGGYPSGGYPQSGRPEPVQPSPYHQPDPYAQPTPDPYAQPSTNLYGQPTDPYAQQAMSPYGSYAGGAYSVYAYPQQPVKSKATAALLAFFLGPLGVHQFYLGRNGLGLGHLALAGISLVLMVLGIVLGVQADLASTSDGYLALVSFGYLAAMANGLWAFVDFIIILAKPESDLGR